MTLLIHTSASNPVEKTSNVHTLASSLFKAAGFALAILVCY